MNYFVFVRFFREKKEASCLALSGNYIGMLIIHGFILAIIPLPPLINTTGFCSPFQPTIIFIHTKSYFACTMALSSAAWRTRHILPIRIKTNIFWWLSRKHQFFVGGRNEKTKNTYKSRIPSLTLCKSSAELQSVEICLQWPSTPKSKRSFFKIFQNDTK